MDDVILDYYRFVTSLTLERFVRLFWYFFILDFARYIFLDLLILSIAYLKKSFSHDQHDAARKRLFNENPLVSVIVPGKNEGKYIPALSRSLQQQTYKNIEVIVVDDGSDDRTSQICRDALKKGLIKRFFRNEVRGGKASAANLALRYSQGKYIVHLDADSHLFIDAIEQLIIPFFLDANIGATGGDVRVNNTGDSLAASLQGIEYGKSISIGRQVTSYLGILRIISGAFGAFRKDILDRIHGWDVGPGLDGDITLKIRKLKYKVQFVPQAICFTNVPVSFYKLAKQRYRWNRSTVRFRLRKHFDILTPDENFSALNLFASLDSVLFNFILNFYWWIYVFDMLFNFMEHTQYLLVINYALYIISNFFKFSVILLLSPNEKIRRKDFNLLIYLPLMPFYSGIYLRAVGMYAQIMELFFKKSYEDPWNPWKVSRMAKKEEA